MSKIPRRVVTGLDADGKSCVLFDGESKVLGGSTVRMTALAWATAEMPVSNDGLNDQAEGFSMKLPQGGTQFLVTEMMPGNELIGPGLHRTDTIDYGIVLSGRIALILETGETELSAGDLYVDRGVLHGWRVIGEEPVRVAVVMIDAHPIAQTAPV